MTPGVLWMLLTLLVPSSLCFNHWMVTEDGKIEYQCVRKYPLPAGTMTTRNKLLRKNKRHWMHRSRYIVPAVTITYVTDRFHDQLHCSGRSGVCIILATL